MRSGRVVDLRKRKPGLTARVGRMQPLPLENSPKRKSGLRARRRRMRSLVAFAVLALLFLGAYGVSWLSYLPHLSIRSVSVSGAKDIRPEVARAYVETQLWDGSHDFLSRANIFLYPRAAIEKGIVSFFPRVRSVALSRPALLATSLDVNIEEREAYARWCDRGDACYLMDEEGFIFAPVGSTSPLAAEIFRGGLSATSSPVNQTFLPGLFTGVRSLLERLGQAGFDPREVAAESDRDFSLVLSSGVVIRASFGANVESLERNLRLVLASDALREKAGRLEYIDLRFGNKVYYKLKGEEQQSAE